MMQPRVLILSSALDTAPRAILLARPMTVGEVVEAQRVPLDLPTIAVMTDPAGNTVPVMRGEWHVRQVTPGNQLSFVPVPAGGSLKSILSAVAGIALAVFAPWAAGALATSMGFVTGTAAFNIATGVIGAGIMVAGQFILNRLLPPPGNTNLSADSVYTARASSNRAMPNEVIPVLYGRLRYPPPYAARPYAEFVDNDQYLYQLHCLSVGHVDPERWEIGDTLVWTADDGFQGSFAGGDTEIEIVRPGDEVKLFPANVVSASTVDGQQVPDQPDWLGPFAVSAPGTEVSRIACDYVFPLGLVYVNKDGKAKSVARTVNAQYRPIDNAGSPLGGWTDLFSSDHSAATRTPQRFSRAADVPTGRYEVRLGASGTDQSEHTGKTSTLNRVVWAGLRGYVEDFATPADVTLVATRIRATEHLSSSAAGQYLFTCQRSLPVWDELDGWSAPVATRNPAWATADMLRALGLADHEYDLGWLAGYAQKWEERGDRFDALFDRRWQASEALDAILRVGRAYHVRLGSIISFVRDEPRQVKRMAFTPDSIVRGSVRRHDVWFSEDSPDHLEVTYLDGESWSERSLIAAIGAVGQDKPQQLAIFGVTDHDHAWREGIFQAAENAFRRSFRTFQTEREGRMLVRGDAVVLADPLHALVGFARLLVRAGDVLTLDRPFEAQPGETYHVALRDRYGREWGPCKVDAIDGAAITLDAADRSLTEVQHGMLSDMLPDTSVSEPAHVTLLAGEDRLFDGLLVEARPVGTELWEVTLVNDDQRVHTVDETEVKPSPWTPPAMIGPVPDQPVVTGVYAELQRGTLALELHGGWQPAAGANTYVAEISYDEDAEAAPQTATWTPVHNAAATRLIAPAMPQPLTLRVAGVGTLQGPWAYRSIVDVPQLYLPPEASDPLIASINRSILQLRQDNNDLLERMNVLAGNTIAGLGKSAELHVVAHTHQEAVAIAMREMAASITKTESGLVAQAEIIDVVQGAVGAVSGFGLRRIEVVAGSGDVVVRLVDMARASIAHDWVEAGQITEVGFEDGDPLKPFSRIVQMASQHVFEDPAGRWPAIIIDEHGTGWFNRARIKDLDATNITADKLDARLILQDGTLITDLFAFGAVTQFDDLHHYFEQWYGNGSQWSEPGWTVHKTVVVDNPMGNPIIEFISLKASAVLSGAGSADAYIRVTRDGVDIGNIRSNNQGLRTFSATSFLNEGKTSYTYEILTWNTVVTGGNSNASLMVESLCGALYWKV